MKKATVFMTVVFIGLICISATADARQGRDGAGFGKSGMGMPPGKWWRLPEVAEKLSLTKEEQEKMNSMYLEHRRQLIDLRSRMAKERLELEDIFESETFNAARCMERFKVVQEVMNTLASERFKLLVQVREMLGADRFRTLKDEFQSRRMMRKQKRK
ncbi:periplasmic heavy metal sensor [Thermodesulfobacteriota bacterium]